MAGTTTVETIQKPRTSRMSVTRRLEESGTSSTVDMIVTDSFIVHMPPRTQFELPNSRRPSEFTVRPLAIAIRSGLQHQQP